MIRTVTVTPSVARAEPAPAAEPASAPAADAELADPCANLPFTLSQIRQSIPAHCFHKSLSTSVYYLLRDFAILGALYAAYPWVTRHGDAFGITKFVWWNAVGFFGWCLFVVGHDCGHRTFCDSVFLCDVFGHLAHTPLLVPFHGWRISHRKHHENHNHVDNDHSWRPVSFSRYRSFTLDTMRSRFDRFLRFSHALLVIFPIYLTNDADLTSGNHLNPWGRLFAEEERLGAAISALCIAGWLGFLFFTFPLRLLLDAYFVPYLIFVIWLDLVTYLHHSDPSVHYYRDGAWSFLKGALSTVDRSYGWLVDHLHHDIGTHMLHHMLFTKIPHYHLVEATEAVKPMLGQHYKLDRTPILQAYLRSKKACHWVPDRAKVVQYHSREEYKVE